MYFLCTAYTFREFLLSRNTFSPGDLFLSCPFLFYFPRHKTKWTSGRQHVNLWRAKITRWAMYWIDCCVTLRIRDSETKLKRSFFSLNSIWLSPVGNPGDPARFDCALCTILVSMEAVFRECLPSLMTFRFAFPFSSSRRIPQARGLETVMAAFCADDGVGPSLCRMLPSLCLRRAELFVQEGKVFRSSFCLDGCLV